jgi:hypothetical protein
MLKLKINEKKTILLQRFNLFKLKPPVVKNMSSLKWIWVLGSHFYFVTETSETTLLDLDSLFFLSAAQVFPFFFDSPFSSISINRDKSNPALNRAKKNTLLFYQELNRNEIVHFYFN